MKAYTLLQVHGQRTKVLTTFDAGKALDTYHEWLDEEGRAVLYICERDKDGKERFTYVLERDKLEGVQMDGKEPKVYVVQFDALWALGNIADDLRKRQWMLLSNGFAMKVFIAHSPEEADVDAQCELNPLIKPARIGDEIWDGDSVLYQTDVVNHNDASDPEMSGVDFTEEGVRRCTVFKTVKDANLFLAQSYIEYHRPIG